MVTHEALRVGSFLKMHQMATRFSLFEKLMPHKKSTIRLPTKNMAGLIFAENFKIRGAQNTRLKIR
jgi:hypothetical protein